MGLGVADSGEEIMMMKRLHEEFLAVNLDELYKNIRPIEMYR